MGYRYIGSKTKITDQVLTEIQKVVPNGGTIVDLMCGTGAISIELRKKEYDVIAVDVMSQACHLTKTKVLLQKAPSFKGAKKFLIKKGQTLLTEQSGYESVIQTLNNLPPTKGYFFILV